MLKLAKDFYITSIEHNCYRSKKNLPYTLEKEYNYIFRYKEYRVNLTIQLDRIGYTRDDNITIFNFGYLVNIKKWSNKEQRFEWIDDLDEEDGSSTKKYLDSKEARAIILKFIHKFIDKHLKYTKPAIIIRGGMSEIKTNLPRYKALDTEFFKHNYIKKIFNIDKTNSLSKIAIIKDKDKELWVYCKKEWYFEQLNDVIAD